MVSHWQSNEVSSSGKGLVFKWYGTDSELVSHWKSYDESQVATIDLQVVLDQQLSGVILAVL